MSTLSLPGATLFGRNIVNGHLASIMMDKPAKPLSAKHKNYCQCSKSKCTKNCSCAAAGVNCIVSCKCTANPRLCARIAEDSEDDDNLDRTTIYFVNYIVWLHLRVVHDYLENTRTHQEMR